MAFLGALAIIAGALITGAWNEALTDYARHIVDRIAEGSDRDMLMGHYAGLGHARRARGIPRQPGSSGALIECLIDMTRVDSFDNVCAATKRLREELQRAIGDAEQMISYRVDCLLHPEAGFECPEE